MGAEIELKLATSKRGLQQAMSQPWLKKQANDASRKQELTSVYFDTDDFVLREHDISLRVRKNGTQRLQTIKANSSALVARQEWEMEIDRDEPKLELARDTALAPLLTAKLTKQLKPYRPGTGRDLAATSPSATRSWLGDSLRRVGAAAHDCHRRTHGA